MAIAVCCWVAYTLMGKELLRRHSPLIVTGYSMAIGAVFYLTFLPQFIHPSEPVLAKSLLFGGAHACIAMMWFAVYAYGVTTLASRIRNAQPWIERLSGVVLIGFAFRLLQYPR